MRVLVTGAAGFLGSHVVSRFLRDGHTVTSFDVAPPATTDSEWFEGDLRDGDRVADAVAGHDVVCHIGAIGDVYLAAADPVLSSHVNVTGSVNVAEAAKRHDARVVYASTWEVYGRPVYEPMDEAHPCSPDHPYSITKLAGERMLLSVDHFHEVPVLALRLGTAYGTGLRSNSVFRIFIDRARNGQPITVQGDGSQVRQFTHASDIAHAFALAARSDVHGMPLNVVSPETISVKELADAIVSTYPTELTFGPSRTGEVPPAMVSAQKSADLLGWRPQMTFEKGLAELIGSD